MNEIIGYFFHPETSIGTLLGDENRKKYQDGLLKWLLVAVIAGFLTIVTYQVAGVKLEYLGGKYYSNIIEILLDKNINEGFVWLVLAGINIVQTLVIAAVRAGVWIVLLYIISKILKNQIAIDRIVKLGVFAILTWIVAQLIGNIAFLVTLLSPIEVVNEMIIGLAMILEYWYLIIFIIGYCMLTRGTILSGGVVIIIIQGIFWGAANMSPVLGTFLG